MIIKNARIILGHIMGNAYNDKNGKFKDGTTVFTSEVRKFYKKGKKNYVVTKNNTYEIEYKEEN